MNADFARNRGLLVPRVKGWPKWLYDSGLSQIALHGAEHERGAVYAPGGYRQPGAWSYSERIRSGFWKPISPTQAAKLLRKWGHHEAAERAEREQG